MQSSGRTFLQTKNHLFHRVKPKVLHFAKVGDHFDHFLGVSFFLSKSTPNWKEIIVK